MTREETTNAIAIMQAYKEGKTIQYSKGKGWYDCGGEPMWNFYDTNYRVKPEPHYRPFKSVEEVMEAIKEHGDWVNNGIYIFKFNFITDKGLGIRNVNEYTFKLALKDCVFADGTPFGVKEE